MKTLTRNWIEKEIEDYKVLVESYPMRNLLTNWMCNGIALSGRFQSVCIPS